MKRILNQLNLLQVKMLETVEEIKSVKQQLERNSTTSNELQLGTFCCMDIFSAQLKHLLIKYNLIKYTPSEFVQKFTRSDFIELHGVGCTMQDEMCMFLENLGLTWKSM